MGDIIRGTSSLSGLYRGNTEIQAVYRGTQEIWSASDALTAYGLDWRACNNLGQEFMQGYGELNSHSSSAFNYSESAWKPSWRKDGTPYFYDTRSTAPVYPDDWKDQPWGLQNYRLGGSVGNSNDFICQDRDRIQHRAQTGTGWVGYEVNKSRWAAMCPLNKTKPGYQILRADVSMSGLGVSDNNNAYGRLRVHVVEADGLGADAGSNMKYLTNKGSSHFLFDSGEHRGAYTGYNNSITAGFTTTKEYLFIVVEVWTDGRYGYDTDVINIRMNTP